MAQKKKKKVATNPARGFATTSIASKTKEPKPDEVRESCSERIASTDASVPGPAGSSETPQQGNISENPLAHLTPEQLEAELEESDLQLLVEQNGLQSRKDAARHASRLQTERRLLRPSAGRLNIVPWLSSEFVDKIFSLVNEDAQCRKREGINHSKQPRFIHTNDLVVKLWTLKRTLLSLGFVEVQIDQAVLGFLSNETSFVSDGLSTSKETLWGLEECIEILAFSCELNDLPGYDTHRTESLEKNKRFQQATQQAARESMIKSSILEKDGSSEVATTGTEAADQTVINKGGQEFTANGSDDELSGGEIDPDDYLDKYIELQKKLFVRRPELTTVEVRRGKKAKTKPTQRPKDLDVKCSRILQRLELIETDILFDRDSATEKWAEIRPALVAEAAQRQRFLPQPERPRKQPSPQESSQSTPDIQIDTSEENNEEEIGLDIGDFFSSLPEQSVDEASGKATISTQSEGGVAVTIRDFGKWSGTSPRRVLEEACKARDSASRVSCVLLSSSSFATRHMLRVEWSKAQDIPPTIELAGVSSVCDERSFTAEMSNISCPDRNQSEAYISTAVLFLVFASSPREEKAYIRLPAIWRDLWAEFAEVKKNYIDRGDRAELREIKQTIEAQFQRLSETTNHHTDTKNKDSRLMKHTAGQAMEKNDPQQPPIGSINTWDAKSSTPLFQQMLKSRMKLPIWSYKDEILRSIDEHQAIVLCGETGCGKSTQVPAFILEHELSSGRPCKIYCTEPRRISAISLARRVSEELGEHKRDVGTVRSLIGYAIRLESQISVSTKLVYATTGIVMRMLERGNDLEDITHLVLDEVHERTIDSDFLLIVLRKLMARRPSLKVVLMSATVNAEQFSKYLGGAPILNVPGRTFPVETRFLEDAIELTNYGFSDNSNRKRSELDMENDSDSGEVQQSTSAGELKGYSPHTRNTLAKFDEYRVDFDIIVRLLEVIAKDPSLVDYSKATLVFLPGMAEIRRLNDMLVGHATFARGWEIFPLHSTISTEDQERAFLVPPPGTRKIVIATNIAETGITIPDVTCVVDVGKHKEMRFDERRQLSRLIESFISRANAKQRRGRAGRVQNGLCFHLFTRARYERMMAEAQTPEMLRLSLQDLALRVKICKLGGIVEVLNEALDPPLAKNVRHAVDSLIDVKALTSAEDLTPLGFQLAKLPLDVYLGKLIIQSHIFRCLDAGVTIAAILSSKSPFQAPMGARAQADSVRLGFSRGNSDLLTVYNAYLAWKRVCMGSNTSVFQFCRRNFLSPQTLSNIEDLKVQLVTAIVDAGFLTLNEQEKASLNRARSYSQEQRFVDLPVTSTTNSTNDLIVDSVIAWSFYPKLLMREGKGYRNVANNQSVSLYPASVNKGVSNPPTLLSFYQIMQSSNKFLNAHETSAVEEFAAALVCGEADFKMYSGVIVIDGNRLRFSLPDWKTMLALKHLRIRIREIIMQTYRSPGRALTASQSTWFAIWQELFMQSNKEPS